MVVYGLMLAATSCAGRDRDGRHDERMQPHEKPSSGSRVLIPHVSNGQLAGRSDTPVWTGVEIYNASRTESARITLHYYHSCGALAHSYSPPDSIEAGESATFLTPDPIKGMGSRPWTGSVVVESERGTPIRASVQVLDASATRDADAYEGIVEPASAWTMPRLDVVPEAATVIAIQNAADETTSVVVRFTDGQRRALELDAHQTGYVWPTDAGARPEPGVQPQRGQVGATVEATHEVAVTVLEYRPSSINGYVATGGELMDS